MGQTLHGCAPTTYCSYSGAAIIDEANVNELSGVHICRKTMKFLGVDFSVNFQSGVDFLLIFPKNEIVTGKDDIFETKLAYIKQFTTVCRILLRNSHLISVNAAIFACISAIDSFIHNFQNLRWTFQRFWAH